MDDQRKPQSQQVVEEEETGAWHLRGFPSELKTDCQSRAAKIRNGGRCLTDAQFVAKCLRRLFEIEAAAEAAKTKAAATER